MKKKVILLSFDALHASDRSIIEKLPHFSKLLSGCALGKTVKGVYPSHTYTTHASVITGVHPDKHGITSNYIPTPGDRKPDWYWQYKHLQSPTLLGLAKEKGLKTATFLWPVTARGPQNYNIPEIWDPKKKKNQILLSLIHGSPLFLLSINQKYGKYRRGTEHPELDVFTMKSVLDLISKKDLDFVLVHLADVDTHRHYYGTDSDESRKALERLDSHLGDLLNLLKSKRELSSTDIIIFGDHGFLDIHQNININSHFHKKGWLTFNQEGTLDSWRVWAHSCEGSCHIYINEKENPSFTDEVYEEIHRLVTDSSSGIERIYRPKDFSDLHLQNGFSLILEGKKGYSFTPDWDLPLYSPVEKDPENKVSVAVHGYHPDKEGYRSLFLATGPSFKKGASVEEMRIIDIAPTIAEILNLPLPNADGRVLDELLEDPHA